MKVVIMLFMSINCIYLFSCNSDTVIDSIRLIPVKSSNNYQYIDKEGKIIINPQFSEATVFRDGIALVKSSGNDPKWGYIDEKGTYLISPTYKDATVFSEGLAWVVSENGAPTAINTKGEIKITLQDAQDVKLFREGLAAYSVLGGEGEKWGFIDNKGNVKINPQFDRVGLFSDGKCCVANSDGKWGYIDKEGKIIINNQFDWANDFVDGKAVVTIGGKAGLIDKSGKYLINPQYSNIVCDNDRYLIELDGQWGWCDEKGKILINTQFQEAYPFYGNELASVKMDKGWAYIDKDGTVTINPQFDFALPFNGDIALVSSSDKVGFVNSEGKYVINPQYDGVSQDLSMYMLTGKSLYSYVETDYFNLGVIMERIKREITDKTVSGLSFTTPMSVILTKYKKNKDDFSRYSSQHALISEEKLSNDASVDFLIVSEAWRYDYSSYDYVFNSSASPTAYAFVIHLANKGIGKEDVITEELEKGFPGYKKNEDESTDYRTVLENKHQEIVIAKGSNNVSVVVQSNMKIEEAKMAPEAAPQVY